MISMNSNKPNIPIVDFYGEITEWPVADLIHYEPLQMRSARHNWEIKPHRHNGLVQIVYLQDGAGQIQVDSKDIKITGPGILIIPEMCVHKFVWEVDSSGSVLFIAKPLLIKLNDLFGTQGWGGSIPAFHSTASNNNEFIESTFTMIAKEYRQNNQNRELLLETLITSLSIWLSRQTASTSNVEYRRSKSEERYSQFLQLIEENYMNYHSVAWYAEHTGISGPHLNSICQKIKQQSALNIIQDRLLTEAQRSLIYTGLSAAEISNQLGFSEPSYFNRFFKRKTNTTPKKFREQALLNNTENHQALSGEIA